MDTEKVLEINHLVKKYKNGRGVNDISFSIREGEVVGLLGPNGSGKTTIMKCIIGFQRYDSGNIQVFGKDPGEDIEGVLSRVGSLIEQPALYENLTAMRQLKMMARFYPGLDPQCAEMALKNAGLERYGNEKVRRYSLGMKQRLGIALALLSDPDFVILDERRAAAGIHPAGKAWFLTKLSKQELDTLQQAGQQKDENEQEIEVLFQSFCRSLSILERQNQPLQQQLVPLKYRMHMTEFQKK